MNGFVDHVKKLRCEICEYIVICEYTDSFKSPMGQRTYFIKPTGLKCSSEHVLYLFTCKTCSKQ